MLGLDAFIGYLGMLGYARLYLKQIGLLELLLYARLTLASLHILSIAWVSFPVSSMSSY